MEAVGEIGKHIDINLDEFKSRIQEYKRHLGFCYLAQFFMKKQSAKFEILNYRLAACCLAVLAVLGLNEM